jgi:mono/diheme cytochrome c family protein
VAAAGWLAFLVLRLRPTNSPHRMSVALLLSFIIMPMLLTRQILQDRVLYPLGQRLQANARMHSASLQPFAAAAMADFAGTLGTPYDNGLALYTRSCSFCHGAVGNGRGDSAGDLDVPPEDLTRIRMRDDKLTAILLAGIDGSAMPRFDFYLDDELTLLRGFLRDKVGLGEKVETVTHASSANERSEADKLFDSTCSVCHGKDGRGSDTGRPMRPPPPDLTQVGFSASREFQVVTEGYPGTLMRSFADVPEGIRWALVRRVHELYRPGLDGPEARLDAGAEDASSEDAR